MKYDHVLWDHIMAIMQHVIEHPRMEQKGGFLRGDLSKIYNQAVTELYLTKDQIRAFIEFAINEQFIIPDHWFPDMTEAEREVKNGDIKGVTTAEAKRAVEAAQKRLEERERMRPVTEAQAALDQAKSSLEATERAAILAEEEKKRPEKELSEAQAALKQAEKELKAAELSIKK